MNLGAYMPSRKLVRSSGDGPWQIATVAGMACEGRGAEEPHRGAMEYPVPECLREKTETNITIR